MAITSVGYDGTVDEKQFRDIMGFSASSEYGVAEPGGFAASTVAGQVLQVRLTAGTAWTAGVVDKMDAAETVQLEATTGTRWDMIVLRRDYQPPSGATALRVLRGGSSMTLASRATNTGVLDDQPLWLVKLESGKSTPTQYVDLRVWARNGGATAKHDLVRSYLNGIGTEVEINGTLWLLRNGANNQAEWVKPIELALDAAATNESTVGSIVRRSSSGSAAFQRVWLDGPQSSSINAATRKDYVDEKIAGRAPADHTHEALYNGKHAFYLLGGGSFRCEGAYDQTANINPNVYVSSGGTFGRSTANSSLREYKTNIRPADLDPADVLALEPVIYDRKDGSGENELGLIAEDTQQAIPNLTFDEDGRLEGVRYDRVAVALLSVVKDQQEQIAALTDRLDKLEGK